MAVAYVSTAVKIRCPVRQECSRKLIRNTSCAAEAAQALWGVAPAEGVSGAICKVQ